MVILSIILGILMVICGFSLICTPLATFLSIGYYLVILFFVSGLFGIIKCIGEKRFGLEFVLSIISIIFGIAGFFIPGAVLMTDVTLLYIAAAWFIIRGVITIFISIKAKEFGASGGRIALGVILGILELILGVYSLAHPMVMAIGLGFLIGFYFIEYGFNLIFIGSMASAAQEELEKEAQNGVIDQ